MEKEVINVLWVDDEHTSQSSFVPSNIQKAKIKYGVHIKSYSNWEEAKKELEHNFDKYSAIILNAHCKVSANSVATHDFLYDALVDMSALFGARNEDIPWYVLSMVDKVEEFDDTIKKIMKFRKNREEDWGIMTYVKRNYVSDKEKEEGRGTVDMLFENIKKVAPQRKVTRILNRHKETFRYVGEGKLIDGYIRDEEVSNVLLKMLAKVYFPEENKGYQINENDMRQIVERLFHTAWDYGLLSDKCLKKDGSLSLLDCCRYMSGIVAREAISKNVIFPSCTGKLLQSLINYTGEGSHIDSRKDYYFVEKEDNELLIANVFNLCYIIRCFGKYFDKHPNDNECEPHFQGPKVIGEIEL